MSFAQMTEAMRPQRRHGENSLGMRMARIPRGVFLMGAAPDDLDADESERPRHRVDITRSFVLGVCPVTQQQFAAVMGSNPSQLKGADRPVERVSWFDAVEFCNRLSRSEDMPYYYLRRGGEVYIAGGQGYRLPTEAEWEYACRAGGPSRWFSGESLSYLHRCAWNSENNRAFATHQVAQKEPNPWGLFDMHGNVAEWCWDWAPTGCLGYSVLDRRRIDPDGAPHGEARIVRGGHSYSLPRCMRSSARDQLVPSRRVGHVGFRVARSLPWESLG